jgi:sugar phosphate isomerase/epimerase
MPEQRLSQLSLNQATAKRLTIPEAVDLCARHGLGGIGLWRDRIAETGVDEAGTIVRDAGLVVTSVCRGGFFTSGNFVDAIEENRAAIRETAGVGARELVLVCGGLPAGSRDVNAARERVADGITELAPYAADHGVRLAIEPMHPVFASDRSVINTLAQALDLAERFPADQVGVVVDTYHVWWDPDIERQIARAGERIAAYQISDWVVPLPDLPDTGNLLGRVQVGDGCIDFASLTQAVGAAGYRGYVEVEIFNTDVWAAPGERMMRSVIEGFRRSMPTPLPWA